MQSRYNYVFDNITNTYNFTTQNDILYRVVFIVDETFSVLAKEEVPNVYQLVVEKADEDIVEPYDIKVSKTIEHIVEGFFQRIDNSLIYVCSEKGEKGSLRHRVFDRWYQKSEHRTHIIKIDNVLNIKVSDFEYQKLYTSFMFHKDNPNCVKLVGIYEQFEDLLNSSEK